MPKEWFCEEPDCFFHVPVDPDTTWIEVAPPDRPLEPMTSGRQRVNGKSYCDTHAAEARTPVPHKD